MERRTLVRAFALGAFTLTSVPAMMLAGCSKSEPAATDAPAVFRVGVTPRSTSTSRS